MGKQFPVIIIILFVGLNSEAQNSDTVAVLSLEECINRALSSSPRSARIEAERVETQTNVYTSLSPVLPFFSISSGWNRSGPQFGTIIEVPGNPPIITEQSSLSNFQTSFSLAQTIVDIPSFVQVSQIPDISRLATYGYKSSRAMLAFDVKQQFYALLILYSNVRVSLSAVEQVESQIEVAREQFRLGVIARPELLRVEVALLQQRVESVNARAQLVNGLRALAYLIGADRLIRIDTTLAFPDTSQPLPLLDSLQEIVLQKSPSYQISMLNKKTQQSSELAAKLRILPTISGSFTYGSSAPEIFADWQENDFWYIGIDLNWSVFERLTWYARVRQSAAKSSIARAEVELTRTALIEEMNQAYANLQASQEALFLIPDLLEQAGEEFRLVREQFRLGAASALDYLQSQLVFNESQRQAITIITNFYLAQAQIKQLIGEW